MVEKAKMVKISFESWKTLQRLSQLSDRDMNSLVEEWLDSLSKVLASYEGDFSRISILSWRHEKSNDCVTRLAPIYTGSIALKDLTYPVSEKVESAREDYVLEKEMQKKRQKVEGDSK